MTPKLENNQTKGKYIWISKLRIVATLAVIWLHTNGTIWGNQNLFELTYGQKRFFAVNYYLMWWAVPVFFMLTGCLLLNKEKSITAHECLIKYVRRILIALTIFGAFYSLIILVSEGERGWWIIPKTIKGVMTGNTFSHLWYCYELIGIYLILPILKCFVDNAKEQTYRYCMIVIFLFDFIVPFIGTATGVGMNFYIPLSYSLFYVLCGYWLTKVRNSQKRILVVVGIAMALAITAVAYIRPIENNPYIGYNSPIVAIMAISIFGLFNNIQGLDENYALKPSDTLWKMDRLCFGVYLIHPLFIQGFYRILGFTPISFRIYQIGTIVIWLIVCVASFATSWVLNKIPLMRRYVL